MTVEQQLIVGCLLQSPAPLTLHEVAERSKLDETVALAALLDLSPIVESADLTWTVPDREAAARELNASRRAAAMVRGFSSLCRQAGA